MSCDPDHLDTLVPRFLVSPQDSLCPLPPNSKVSLTLPFFLNLFRFISRPPIVQLRCPCQSHSREGFASERAWSILASRPRTLSSIPFSPWQAKA